MALPARIGRYEVQGALGQGAMGTVYRARDGTLERDVAIKVMSRGLSDADARARFLREARAAARLQHPNIVVIYELGEHEGAPFMALELLEGVDLQHGIERGVKPDPRATLPVVLQLLAGLGHAHDHGIVHRDVKPSNVFLPSGSRPSKIMDFGVARLAGFGTTTAGAMVGTPNYMSPEQASGGAVDGRSDLFSVGLILYELVTGERAFQADTVVAIVYKILHEAPDLSLIPPKPEWERLRAVLTRALARSPDERFADARAMQAELALALLDLGGGSDWASSPAQEALLVRTRAATSGTTAASAGASHGTPAPPPARPPRGRRAALAVGGAALAASLALGVAWLAPRRKAPPPPPPTPGSPPKTEAAAPSPAPASPPFARPSTPPAPAEPVRTRPPASPTPPPPTPPAGPESPPATAPLDTSTPARLARARDLVARGRFADALAEARAVLEKEPTNAEASALAQQAEEEVVIEECLRNARAALREGDRDRALSEIRRGFLVRKNDRRLLDLHREAVQQ
jgi:hypothetical protein